MIHMEFVYHIDTRSLAQTQIRPVDRRWRAPGPGLAADTSRVELSAQTQPVATQGIDDIRRGEPGHELIHGLHTLDEHDALGPPLPPVRHHDTAALDQVVEPGGSKRKEGADKRGRGHRARQDRSRQGLCVHVHRDLALARDWVAHDPIANLARLRGHHRPLERSGLGAALGHKVLHPAARLERHERAEHRRGRIVIHKNASHHGAAQVCVPCDSGAAPNIDRHA